MVRLDAWAAGELAHQTAIIFKTGDDPLESAAPTRDSRKPQVFWSLELAGDDLGRAS